MFEVCPCCISCLECQDVHHPVPPSPGSSVLHPAGSDSSLPVRIHKVFAIDIPCPPLRNLSGGYPQGLHSPGRAKFNASLYEPLKVSHTYAVLVMVYVRSALLRWVEYLRL